MTGKIKVVVAMSGGVDSSLAAALLVEQGYDVAGWMLHLWADPDAEFENRCCASNAVAVARRVAAVLGIPFQLLDAQEFFRARVVAPMMDSYAAGRTPNPCLECNRFVRWGFLLDRALAMGANLLATGHYARIRMQDERYQLLRGTDPAKDQSYMLSILGQKELAHTLFPLGSLTKPEVREQARRRNLPAADRPESQDLCFVAGRDYRRFLNKYLPQAFAPGPILNLRGEELGRHPGLVGYTVGQRKGIRVASPFPLFVLEIDPARNALIVGSAEELGKSGLRAEGAHWVGGEAPPSPFHAEVKIRSTAPEQPAEGILEAGGRMQIRFGHPLRDITPGQAAVFYRGETCLGMATIREALT